MIGRATRSAPPVIPASRGQWHDGAEMRKAAVTLRTVALFNVSEVIFRARFPRRERLPPAIAM